MKKYDLCIIGAGSGGLVAATTGNRLGLKTLMIEKNIIGGECTHSGCVPSKAIINSAKSHHLVENASAYGLPEAGYKELFNFGSVMEHVDGIIQSVYKNETPEVFEEMGIDVIIDKAGAQFITNKHLQVGDREFIAENTVICTGSSPRIFAPDGSENIQFLTNENFWQLRKQPQSITFIGGGVISAELSQTMRRFGSEVNVIEHNPRILKVVDDEVAEVIIDIFEKEGIHLYQHTEVVKCVPKDEVVKVYLKNGNGSAELETETLFLAVGRSPNVLGMHLENTAIEYDDRGIKVNEYLQTSAENIYACGDVASPAKFTHAASYQADICVKNIIHGNHLKNDLNVFPWVIFTDPEIAHVGLSEIHAREKFNNIQVLKVKANLDRFVTDLKTTGFIKIILNENDRILGADAIGAHSGEWIQLITMAIKNNISVESFADTIVAYPTFSEIVKKAFVRHLRTRE
jgi:pyruvate/2-oxoglutarate dehydrogenase complex dihydrolipoamide dehydrogenase (E3) component